MVVISVTELIKKQKKYLDLAEKEKVIIKRKGKLIELVVKDKTIADSSLRSSPTASKQAKVSVRQDTEANLEITDLQKFLLQGPTMTDSQYERFKQNRNQMNQ